MEQIIITPGVGSSWSLLTRAEVSTLKSCIQKRSLLGQDTLEMIVESASPLPFKIRDTINIFGSSYYLNALPKVTKSGSRLYEYAMTWEGRQYDLLHAKYLDEGDDGVSISARFSLTGDIELFLNVLVNNLDRVYGAGKWILGSYPTTKYLTLTFDEENCLAVLQKLCGQENFNLEFEIVEDTPGVCTINIEDAVGSTHVQTYRYGKGRGLYSLTRQTVSNKNLITRLYAFGSDINLPSNYRGFSQSLKLPGNVKSFIEDDAAIAQFGLIEGSKTFSDIYPHRTGIVTSLGTTIQRFIDSGMDFDINAVDGEGNTLYLINGTAPKIHFNTGNLAGYDFEISSYDHGTKTFALKAFKDERGMVFPNESSAFQFQVGDEYVIFDIIMPLTYITEAENELLIEATKYLDENSQPRVQYALTFDEFYLEKTFGGGASVPNIFSVGDYITIQDTEIGVNKAIRIHTFTRDLLRPYSYNLELTDIKEISLFQQVLSDVMETSKIIAYNKLNDVSRAKRNWRATQELLDMVFDPDGYFDGTRIKPESIETMMLSVGTRSQQLSISCTFEPNYGGDAAEVNITAGTLSHYGLGDDILNWNISASQPTLLNTGAYYIYAKCSKSDNSGNILFSQTQFKVDDDPDYYHFLLGVLHSVEDNVRWISMTYGATAINGRYIRTGRITSQDGLNYFDLDQNQLMMGDAESSLDWNVTAANRLTLKGALVQSAGGATAPLPVFRGDYSPIVTYYKGDQVRHGGKTWMHIFNYALIGVEPIEGALWTAISEGGSAVSYSLYCGANSVTRSSSGQCMPSAVLFMLYKKEGAASRIPTESYYIVEYSTDGRSFTYHFDGGPSYGINISFPSFPMTWKAIRVKMYLDAEFTIELDSAIVQIIDQADMGPAGPSLAFRGEFNEYNEYYNNSLRRDIVKNGQLYYFYKGPNGMALAWDDDNWESAGGNFESIATGLLFAEMAFVDNLGVRVFEGQAKSYGNLSGSFSTIQANQSAVARVDHIDMEPEFLYGSADISCNGVSRNLTSSGNLVSAIESWVAANYTAFYNAGIIIDCLSYTIIFTSRYPGTDFTAAAAISNESGIYGTASVYTANQTAQARIDSCTLSGTGGCAYIIVSNVNGDLEFNSTLTQTAADFVSAYADLYDAAGITVTNSSNLITFTAKVAGTNFVGTSIIRNNQWVGSIKIVNNEIWENAANSDTYGAIKINDRGYQGGYTRYRATLIGDGKGTTLMGIVGADAGGMFKGLNLVAGMPIRMAQMTTTQINALTAYEGTLAYDITTHTLKIRTNTGWKTVSAS